MLLLAACGPLDTEQTVLDKAREWVFVDEVIAVHSRKDCTAAAMWLTVPQLRYSGLIKVRDVRSSLPHLEKGRAVAFTVADATPNEVSEQLMSMRLFEGLGLLGSFLAPSKRCMDQPMMLAAEIMLHSPDAVFVYDPSAHTVLLADPSRKQALFLRTGI